MKTKRKFRVVIDADRQKILHKFEISDTNEVFEHFKRVGMWSDVSVDQMGDIILWED